MFGVLPGQPNRLLNADNLFSFPLFPLCWTQRHCESALPTAQHRRILPEDEGVRHRTARHPRQVYYGAVGKRRYFPLPIGVEADRADLCRCKGLRSWGAAHREQFCERGELNSFGGVTAAQKREFELQPAAVGRCFVIDGEALGIIRRLVSAVRKGGLVPPGV